MQVKIQRMSHLSGCDRVTMLDGDNDQTVDFIRLTVVEQREHDLLKQLEVAEDTVDVLEQLLAKYGAEIQNLRAQQASRAQFFDHIREASKIVDTWPEWKKVGLTIMSGEI